MFSYGNAGMPGMYQDLNGDGIPDLFQKDMNGDGTPDILQYDVNGDGIPDILQPGLNQRAMASAAMGLPPAPAYPANSFNGGYPSTLGPSSGFAGRSSNYPPPNAYGSPYSGYQGGSNYSQMGSSLGRLFRSPRRRRGRRRW